jgi:hypothetical protein
MQCVSTQEVMASKTEITEKIYSVMCNYSGRNYDLSSSSAEDILRSIETMPLKHYLELGDGEMIGFYSEFLTAFDIEIYDLLKIYSPTVGELVNFILSRVDTD